ncbi:MAG: type II secretion system protein [Verrucomicrobiota bacterium]
MWYSKNNLRLSLERKSGFTLVELLVCIAIVAVLSGILASVVTTARKSAMRAGGVNSLRQTGAAIQLFTQDHSQTLPGPLWPGQVPFYQNEERERLAYWLSPYFDLPRDAVRPMPVKVMIPPAYPMDEIGTEPRTYVANTKYRHPDTNEIINYWGTHPFLAKKPEDSIPMTVTSIPVPAQAWALMDADRENRFVKFAPWAIKTPEKPIHGRVRHVLYFDWHVEAVGIDEEL